MSRSSSLLSTTILALGIICAPSLLMPAANATPLLSAAEASQSAKRIRPIRQPKIQIALLLDTSGSMDGLIDQAKSQLWMLVNELGEGEKNGMMPVIELALYQYGNDSISASKGYVEQILPLTTDLDGVSEKLFALSTNGGQEYAGTVLTRALDELEWSAHSDDMRLMIIAGNEPFTQGPVSYQSACAIARKNDVLIDTIHCGNEQTGIEGKWKAGADCGGGMYMVINQDEKSVYVPSPYDDEIQKKNEALNKTYYGYGASGRVQKQRQMAQDANAKSMSPKSVIARTKSKSSANYANESWDIVDGYGKDAESIIELEDTQLPEEMRGLSKEERITFIEEKTTERKTIQIEIKELNKKRDAHVAKIKKDMAASNTIDEIVVNGARTQAEAKGYVFH
ncbi:MAG: vWA domain-containing protein [Maricaulaceae bacterium]